MGVTAVSLSCNQNQTIKIDLYQENLEYLLEMALTTPWALQTNLANRRPVMRDAEPRRRRLHEIATELPFTNSVISSAQCANRRSNIYKVQLY